VREDLSRAIDEYLQGSLSLAQLHAALRLQICESPDSIATIRATLSTQGSAMPLAARELLLARLQDDSLDDDPSSAPGDPTRLRHADRGSIAEAASPGRICAESNAELGLGSVLAGRYRLIRELGHGGMGVVFLADSTVDGQQFAVKVLGSGFREHPDAVRVLREEARKSLILRHPNIVGVYPLEQDGSNYYLPMEYLAGKTCVNCSTMTSYEACRSNRPYRSSKASARR